MTRFPDAELVVIGRTVTASGGSYYMSETHRDLLQGMATQFGTATYLCQAKRSSRPVTEQMGRIDQNTLSVRPNWSWKESGGIGSVSSLRSEIAYLVGTGERVVTYTYYPGFYSFLLSPAIFRYGSVNISHFGSNAVETAEAAYGRSLCGRAKSALYARSQQYVINRADVALSTGPGMAAEYPETILSRPLLKFDMDEPHERTDLCETNPIKLLYVGAFRPVKGHEPLIETFDRLQSTADREYRLTLVGDGSIRDRIETLVERKGLGDAVKFTGYIPDEKALKNEYRSADVFVLPSLKEAVPWVLYEASMMGLPIVSTDVGGIGSFFEQEEHALLVPPGSAEQLANGIERVVNDAQLRDRLVATAQSKVADHIGADPVKQRLDRIATTLDDAT